MAGINDMIILFSIKFRLINIDTQNSAAVFFLENLSRMRVAFYYRLWPLFLPENMYRTPQYLGGRGPTWPEVLVAVRGNSCPASRQVRLWVGGWLSFR